MESIEREISFFQNELAERLVRNLFKSFGNVGEIGKIYMKNRSVKWGKISRLSIHGQNVSRHG